MSFPEFCSYVLHDFEVLFLLNLSYLSVYEVLQIYKSVFLIQLSSIVQYSQLLFKLLFEHSLAIDFFYILKELKVSLISIQYQKATNPTLNN